MCKKSPEQCKTKVKCKCCVKPVDKGQRDGKLSLNEMDNNFEQQNYAIDVKGE